MKKEGKELLELYEKHSKLKDILVHGIQSGSFFKLMLTDWISMESLYNRVFPIIKDLGLSKQTVCRHIHDTVVPRARIDILESDWPEYEKYWKQPRENGKIKIRRFFSLYTGSKYIRYIKLEKEFTPSFIYSALTQGKGIFEQVTLRQEPKWRKGEMYHRIGKYYFALPYYPGEQRFSVPVRKSILLMRMCLRRLLLRGDTVGADELFYNAVFDMYGSKKSYIYNNDGGIKPDDIADLCRQACTCTIGQIIQKYKDTIKKLMEKAPKSGIILNTRSYPELRGKCGAAKARRDYRISIVFNVCDKTKTYEENIKLLERYKIKVSKSTLRQYFKEIERSKETFKEIIVL